MYFLIYIGVICVIYVNAFKDNFTKEHIDKVTPLLIGFCVFVGVLAILSGILL